MCSILRTRPDDLESQMARITFQTCRPIYIQYTMSAPAPTAAAVPMRTVNVVIIGHTGTGDTIGIGDTDLDQPTVLKKIAKVVKDFPDGIHGIFFVFDGKFKGAERTAYSLITKVLFPGCEPYLYLIRNKFRFCLDMIMCQKDIAALGKDEGTKAIFSRTPADHIVHVDSNPLSPELRDYTKDVLLTIIGALEKAYSPPEYQEIYERIKDTTTDEEAGRIVESLTQARLDRLSGLELLGLGLGRTANDFKAALEKKCTIM